MFVFAFLCRISDDNYVKNTQIFRGERFGTFSESINKKVREKELGGIKEGKDERIRKGRKKRKKGIKKVREGSRGYRKTLSL